MKERSHNVSLNESLPVPTEPQVVTASVETAKNLLYQCIE